MKVNDSQFDRSWNIYDRNHYDQVHYVNSLSGKTIQYIFASLLVSFRHLST